MNQLIFDKDNNWDIYGTDDALNCHVAVMLCRNSSVCISQCGDSKIERLSQDLSHLLYLATRMQ